MKTLTQIIKEALNAAQAVLDCVMADGLNSDQMTNILCQNDMKILKQISDILKAKHRDKYFPYEPVADDFIKDTMKEKVAGQIVDAINALEKK